MILGGKPSHTARRQSLSGPFFQRARDIDGTSVATPRHRPAVPRADRLLTAKGAELLTAKQRRPGDTGAIPRLTSLRRVLQFGRGHHQLRGSGRDRAWLPLRFLSHHQAARPHQKERGQQACQQQLSTSSHRVLPLLIQTKLLYCFFLHSSRKNTRLDLCTV